ncbi:eukaryotic integral membrane protein [Neolentinus lepideus HHB14362 ss-1]|uniref:Eukaryotic integral membrane protein n=1 Tax=Neolentinus lepideus HHB14362 ss-1 TaxID=1314782 RepID=A0A165W8E5_9AGAM|nr:eukaryotic integral membrane protein [Neolentinus lepideus HHB14362 ss-1]
MALLSSPLQYITSTPPVTRAFTAATVLCSGLYFWLSWRNNDAYSAPYLTLIPGASIFYPWTFLTAGLVETSVIELAVTLLVVPASLRYMERLWGGAETAKFIAVSIAIPNVISFTFNWIEFIATRNADLFLYGMQYHGQMALQTAVLVGFTQIIPEHQVQVFGFIKARVKRLPMAYVTLSTVLCLVGLQCPYILIQFGWLVAYVWLRFYKKNAVDVVGGGPAYGDHSDTFAFVHWFPPFIHTPITLLANTVHKLASQFHLIPSPGADLESGGYAPVPGGARAEAERRRAMALKALDQRLANSQSPAPSGSSNDPSKAVPSRQSTGSPSGKATSEEEVPTER